MNTNKNLLTRNTSDFLHANLDGEMVLMHVDSAEYFGMDKTTTYIWELLEENMTQHDLVNQLLTQFDVDYDTCQKDLQPVLEDMLEKKMLFLITNR